jgi:hypothetical protein
VLGNGIAALSGRRARLKGSCPGRVEPTPHAKPWVPEALLRQRAFSFASDGPGNGVFPQGGARVSVVGAFARKYGER